MAIGVALVGVAIALRAPVEPLLGGRNVFVAFEPAIAIAAWYGGLLSGTSATATSVLASAVLYLHPIGSLAVADQGDQLALLLFTLNGVVLSALSSGLRRAFERATQVRQRAEEAVVRSERLQRFALALNRPMAPATLAKTAIIQAVELLGGVGGLVATGRATDAELHVLATHGYTGVTKAGDGVPNETTNPLGEVLRKGEPIVFHGRAERQSRYPSLAARFTVEGDSMVIPMLYEGAATGAIYLNFQGS
ncbi:MAG: DUF4118 domain-containing protein, partial [Candidatus Limnocylindrales bacterium]